MLLNRASFDKSCYWLLPILLFWVGGCAHKEINQLQGSVSSLENQIRQYQVQANRESSEATTTLTEIQRAVDHAFRQYQASQVQMGEQMVELSNRVGVLEQDLSTLQNHQTRVEGYATETANLTHTVQQNNESLQQQILQVANTLNQLRDTLQQTHDRINEMQAQTEQSLRQAQAQLAQQQNSLENRLASLETQTREMSARASRERRTSEPAAPADAGEGRHHTVGQGETLSSIAQKYNVSMRELQNLNGVEDPSKILIGQRLRIP
jgi:LysM repeat protein